MTHESDIRCDLDALTREQREERGRLLDRLRGALARVEETERGWVLHFEAGREVGTELALLAAHERRCCPFLDLDVEVSDDAARLRVTGPPEAGSVVAAELAALIGDAMPPGSSAAPSSRSESFGRRWAEASTPDSSAALRPLLERFHHEFLAEKLDRAALRDALVGLLERLAGAAEPRRADIYTVDAFVCLLTVERDEMFERLPAAYRELLDDLSLDLHDGLRDPVRAEACGASPRALLARARALPDA